MAVLANATREIPVQPTSQTIVRKVRGGSDPASDRFVIIYETPAVDSSFAFRAADDEMTVSEVCEALVARGISEQDAVTLLSEAAASFDHP
jgi:hypothetical protein